MAPSPILAGGIVVAVAPNNAIFGVRVGGRGDLTASNVAWKAEDGVPDATSPVSDGQRMYVVNSEGMLTCYSLQTGKPLWNHEYEDKFYASPAVAGDTLILLSRKGVAYLLQTGDAFKETGRGEVGEECGASPVPRGTRLYIRGHKHLFCIEKAETK